LLILVLGIWGFWDTLGPILAPYIGIDTQNNAEMLGEGLKYDVTAEDVDYFASARGYIAQPTEEGSYPGIVMIHEWWGLNGGIKDMARQLAGEGYLVLAVDLYDGEVAATADEARALRTAIDEERTIENMNAAIARLRAEGATSLASLGWCFGGGQSLQFALARGDGEPPLGLDATVIYYGSLVMDVAELAKLQWPVLGIFGGEDQSISIESVNAFEAALNELNIENEIHIYPGVGHAFANPSGASYAPDETRDAWEKTLTFLKRNLK
jgi:carboxymethylenebutenolidase